MRSPRKRALRAIRTRRGNAGGDKGHIVLACLRGEETCSALMALLAARAGYAVMIAPSAEDALWLAEYGHCDLVLAEVAASNGEANELARRVKGVRADLPCILFSRQVNGWERACHADWFIPELCCDSEEILLRVGIALRSVKRRKSRTVASVEKAS